MNAKIVSIYIKGISNYSNSEFKIDFYNYKRATNKYYELENLVSSLYVHTVMGLVGANASGKSMSLELTKWIIGFFTNNKDSLSELKHIAFFEDMITFKVVLFDSLRDNSIMQNTLIVNNLDRENPFVQDEVIDLKFTTERQAKESILDFSNTIGGINRNDVESFFRRRNNDINESKNMNENTINEFKLNNKTSMNNYFKFYNKIDVFSEACQPKLNESFNNIRNTPLSLIKYLDSSISSIETLASSNESNKIYKLIFNDDNEITGGVETISTYLSSGTVRGVEIFAKTILALESGGYFFIDEIEVSLHKALVVDLIKIFNSPRTNPNHAILIFSTHYSEILESLRRTDSLHLCSKNQKGKLEINNFSKLMERNDISKSELYLTGMLRKPTAPNYFLYQNFLKDLEKLILKEKHNA
jgi:hypothetical protein